jgi:hypothetical protein
MSSKQQPLLSERLWEIIKSLDGNVADWVIDDLTEIHDDVDNMERSSQQVAGQRNKLLLMLARAVKVLERTSNDTLDGRNTATDATELIAECTMNP